MPAALEAAHGERRLRCKAKTAEIRKTACNLLRYIKR